MIEGIGNDQNILLLQKCLDAAAMRHKVISNNIANASTPGFKASDISFQGEVRQVIQKNNNVKESIDLKTTNSKHIALSAANLSELVPRVISINNTYRQIDGNNVDIDREMTTIAENSLAFRTYTRLIGDSFSQITSAIKGQ
jgi:flagellar basal-body rod protein FlgB